MTQARRHATVSQLRDFVGKLGGFQAEHRAIQLRKSCWGHNFRRCSADDRIQLA